jgi:CBS domain-containing protein
MSRSCTTTVADATLQQVIDQHILGRGHRCLVIMRDEEAAGLLTLHQIREVPREKWATVTAAEAMTPVAQIKWVRPEAELRQALEEMDRDGVNQLPVMTDGTVVGMLSREDVISYLRTLQELGM